MLYRTSPPENSPAFDDWFDAQEEKKELLKRAETITEAIPVEFANLDELEIAAALLTDARQRLDDIMNEYRRLEDQFPGGHEPDPDTAYDDARFEGDR